MTETADLPKNARQRDPKLANAWKSKAGRELVHMLDINSDSVRQGFWKHFPAAGLIGVVIALEMSFVLTRGFDLPVAKAMPPEVAALPNAKALGIDLYTNYLFPVQVAAVILLVGIIAAIALTLRKRKEEAIDDNDAAAIPDTADTPEVAVMKGDKADALAHGKHLVVQQAPASGHVDHHEIDQRAGMVQNIDEVIGLQGKARFQRGGGTQDLQAA